MKIKPIFAWYDLWVGLFVDTAKQKIYLFPIPMLGLVIDYWSPPKPPPVRIPDILEVDQLKAPYFEFKDEPERGFVSEYERWESEVKSCPVGRLVLKLRQQRYDQYISTLKHKPGDKVEVTIPHIGKVVATVDYYGKLYYCAPMPEEMFRRVRP